MAFLPGEMVTIDYQSQSPRQMKKSCVLQSLWNYPWWLVNDD
jgi:hypothetical protein